MTPNETIAEYLLRRFRSTLGGGPLPFDRPLLSSGVIDSFGVLEVMAFLEDTFGITIDPNRHELTEFETVDSIAALVETERQTA
jgi:acyl carrier protein